MSTQESNQAAIIAAAKEWQLQQKTAVICNAVPCLQADGTVAMKLQPGDAMYEYEYKDI